MATIQHPKNSNCDNLWANTIYRDVIRSRELPPDIHNDTVKLHNSVYNLQREGGKGLWAPWAIYLVLMADEVGTIG